MRYEKKFKLLQEVWVKGYDEAMIIVSIMEYDNSDHYIVNSIAKPVHESDITPIVKYYDRH